MQPTNSSLSIRLGHWMTGAAVSGNVCVCPHGLHDSPTGYVRASLSGFFFLADLSAASCVTRDGVGVLPIHMYNFKPSCSAWPMLCC